MKSRTIEFEPGSSDPMIIRLLDRATRQPLPQPVSAVQMRIQDDGSSTVIDGVQQGDAWVLDINALTLSSRPTAYPALIYVDWGNGWRRAGALSLIVLEGW